MSGHPYGEGCEGECEGQSEGEGEAHPYGEGVEGDDPAGVLTGGGGAGGAVQGDRVHHVVVVRVHLVGKP